MIVVIREVLSNSQLRQVSSMLNQGHFIDGRLSAGKKARQVKHNEELPADARQMEQLNGLVMTSLVQHPEYQAATMPYRVAAPYYVRYTEGMGYGAHVDDPVMGPPGGQYRSDVSTTVFLNDPEDYTGGELVIHTTFGEQSIKLPAGDVVVYPSSSLHRVAPVISGKRLVAVTWTQSMLRDPLQRELLFQLYQAREQLMLDQPEAPETTQIDHVYVNLVRMWSEL